MRRLTDKETIETGSVNFSITYFFDEKDNRLHVSGFMNLKDDGILEDDVIQEAQDALVYLLNSVKARYG